MANYSRYATRHALLLPIVAAIALSACDNGTTVSSGTTNPNNQTAERPSTSLTFTKSGSTALDRLSKPGEGALSTTLASNETDNRTLDDLQILVFGPMCAGCHIGGGQGQPSIMDFTSADGTYASLVNKASTNAPSSQLVVPGNANSSHLMKTLEGTQDKGFRMPMRSGELSDELKASVRSWIEAGAKR